MTGRFIVIDGSDGSGKATQTQKIMAELICRGEEVVKFDFPQYDLFFGRMVGKYLNNSYGDAIKLDPYLVSLIYAGDRWQAKEFITKALSEGKTVIANRYVSSNMAHQGVKIKDKALRDIFFDWLEDLEYGVYGVPKPDLIFILHMPTQISQALVDRKETRTYTSLKRDAHESDMDYLSMTAELYRQLAKDRGWILIECSQKGDVLPVEKITRMMMDHL